MATDSPAVRPGLVLVVVDPGSAQFFRVDVGRSLLQPVLGLRRPRRPGPVGERLGAGGDPVAFQREVIRYLAITLDREDLTEWVLVAPEELGEQLCADLEPGLLASLRTAVAQDCEGLSIRELWASVSGYLEESR